MGSIARAVWQSQGLTHQGNVRDHNEDAFITLDSEQLWAVADGMGGHASGEVASRAITEVLQRYRQTELLGRNVDRIRQTLDRVNGQLVTRAEDEEEMIIGSTLALLMIHRRYCVCLWAGDSRIYRLRHGRLTCMTRDHCELEEQVDRGIAREQAERSPYAQSITRAVGGDRDLQLESQISEIDETDIYLICSDGLNKEMSDPEIEAILKSHSPQACAEKLLQTALARRGQDNVTTLVIYAQP